MIVNVEAQDLGLGSGGFDVVHANLSRGLAGGASDAHVMKLNYTPIQHAVHPVEEGVEGGPRRPAPPAAVLALHGQLPCVAFALSRLAPHVRAGYVQTPGGALPGWLSDTVAELLDRGMIADHVTAAACLGGRREAMTVEGALDAAAEIARLGLRDPGTGAAASSALPRRSATVASPRSRTRTRRWRSAAGTSCSCRGSRAAIRGPGIAASATTPRPCSTCSWEA